MAYAKAEDVYKVFEIAMSKVMEDKQLAEKFASLGVVFQQQVSNLNAIVTIELKGSIKPSFGNPPVEPDITAINDDEILNKFWQGKLNLMMAVTKGQVKMKGAVTRAFKLLPMLNPIYKYYVAALREVGRDDLIIK